ncbi:hypothetical protein ACFE04_006128 [Oxalis oulophora]
MATNVTTTTTTTTTSSKQSCFQDQDQDKNEINKEKIQVAIAKAVELRALHAALTKGTLISPAPSNFTFQSSSPPFSHTAPHFSSQDYPVFTPSYADSGVEEGTGNETVLSEHSSRSRPFPTFPIFDYPSEDQRSVITTGSTKHITVLQTSPGTEFYNSNMRRNSLTRESEIASRKNIVLPLTDSHSSVQSQPKSKGSIKSWLFPRFKKKSHTNANSPIRTEPEDVSQVLKDFGILSTETMKIALIEANLNRDAALSEVSEMRSSMVEVKQKLEHLESYCGELKKALGQAKLGSFSIDENPESSNLPVSEEVMTEGFLQIVSESRLSVKQFVKHLLGQIEESDSILWNNLNAILEPYKLSINSRNSKSILQSIINQTLYQDFENCIFQKNGSPKILDPRQDRLGKFESFVSLRNLSWNDVLRKGTKFYSGEFSRFCDQKMSGIIKSLNWTKPWSEEILQDFFVAAKCIWLLHLLAFSFNPPIRILRVEENRIFDSHYMEDMLMERQRSNGSSRVKIMVMPGFYVQNRVLKCKVICRYKSV